jgi:hypothetical protein
VILWLLCPRNHHEWVSLQERPEADGRNPDIDVPSLDVKSLLTLYAEPDRTIYVRDVGSRTAIPEEAILVDDDTALDDAHEQKQPRRDVQVAAGKGLVGWQVLPDGVGGERRQGMVGAEEEFVGGSAKDGDREQNNASQ